MRKLALLIFGVLLVAPVQPQARANYYGPSNGDGCCRFPDNREHTFYFALTGNQSYLDAMNHSFNHLDNGTVMTTKIVSGSNTTDVWYWADYLGGCCLHGRWDCAYVNGAGECESGDAYLNRSTLDGEGLYAKEHTACHEIGHSIGLSHSYSIDSCLEQGLSEPKYMSDHDKQHVLDRYGP